MASVSYDITIIGSGPAGYTAAIYAARANFSTLVIQGYETGGQLMLTTEIENYPGFPSGVAGSELMANFEQQASNFGTKMLADDVLSIDIQATPFVIKTSTQTLTSKAIILATGASAKWLGIPNEQRLRGHGISACATCDGFFFKEKDVVVIGGGDTALEEALFLTKFAHSVLIIHYRETLRASKIMQQRAQGHPKIGFIWNTQVEDIVGEEHVTGIVVKNIETQEVRSLPTQGIFIAIGHHPNTSIFKGIIEMDDHGYILRSSHTMTNVSGIFAAGDVVDHRYRQAITAAGDGCRAALDAEKWLEDHATLPA